MDIFVIHATEERRRARCQAVANMHGQGVVQEWARDDLERFAVSFLRVPVRLRLPYVALGLLVIVSELRARG